MSIQMTGNNVQTQKLIKKLILFGMANPPLIRLVESNVENHWAFSAFKYGMTPTVGHGGSSVDSSPFVRKVVGLNPALAAT